MSVYSLYCGSTSAVVMTACTSTRPSPLQPFICSKGDARQEDKYLSNAKPIGNICL